MIAACASDWRYHAVAEASLLQIDRLNSRTDCQPTDGPDRRGRCLSPSGNIQSKFATKPETTPLQLDSMSVPALPQSARRCALSPASSCMISREWRTVDRTSPKSAVGKCPTLHT